MRTLPLPLVLFLAACGGGEPPSPARDANVSADLAVDGAAVGDAPAGDVAVVDSPDVPADGAAVGDAPAAEVAVADAVDASSEATADTSCTRQQMLCGGVCTNTQESIQNCGACGTVCTTSLPNTYPHCLPNGDGNQAYCEWRCSPGYLDCDGYESTGCELRLVHDAGACP